MSRRPASIAKRDRAAKTASSEKPRTAGPTLNREAWTSGAALLLAGSTILLPLLAAPPLGWSVIPRFGRVSAAQSNILGVLAGIACWFGAVALTRRLGDRAREDEPPANEGARVAARDRSLGRCSLLGLALWWLAGLAGALLLRGDARGAALCAAWQSSLLPALVGAWLVAMPAAVRSRANWRPLWIANGLLALDAIALGTTGSNLVSMLGGDAASGESERGALVTLAGHANYLGSALAILFFLKLRAWRRGELAAPVAASLALADAAALFAVGSRGATLAVLAGLAAWGAFALAVPRLGLRRAVRVLAGLGAAGALAGLVAGLSILPKAGETGGGSGSRSLAGRLMARDPVTFRVHAWLGAIGMMAEHPLLGAGPGQFDAALWDRLARAVEPKRGETSGAPADPLASPFFLDRLRGASHQHAHNELLHAGAERGALGVLGLLLAWGGAMAVALRRREFALAGGLVALAVDAQFGFPLHAPLSALLAALLFALCVREPEESDRFARPPANMAKWSVGILLLGTLVVAAHFQQLASIVPSREALSQVGSSASPTHRASVERWPANVEARRALVGALLRERRLDDALTEAARLADLTNDPLDWSWLGKARLASADYAGAAEAFRVASILSPARPSFAVYGASAAFDAWLVSQGDATAESALFDALKRLRRADFRHPLVALVEGAVAERRGAKRRALAIGREGLAVARETESAAPTTAEESEYATLRAQGRAALERWVAGLEAERDSTPDATDAKDSP